MAIVENPRKAFQFQIELPGAPIPSLLCQQVTLPDSEVEQVAHGDVGHDIKTGGRRTLSNLVVKKLQNTNKLDVASTWFWRWQEMARGFQAGVSIPPSSYKMTIGLTEFAEDGITPLNSWTFTGCWPTKINGKEFDRTSSDNTIESIEFSVDTIIIGQ